VTVRTADAVCLELARDAGHSFNFATRQELMRALKTALASVAFAGNALQKAAKERTIQALSAAYLLEEILTVIEGRGLTSENEYQKARRSGRLRPLGNTQRAAIWTVRDAFLAALRSQD